MSQRDNGQSSHYPWQMQVTDALPASASEKAAVPSASVMAVQALSKAAILNTALILLILILGIAGFYLQSIWLDVNTIVTVPDSQFTNIKKQKIQVLPAPVRYELLENTNNPFLNETLPSQTLLNKESNEFASTSSSTEASHILPIALGTPINSPPVLSPLPQEAVFTLIGIAQGDGGNVATIKITDEQKGLQDSIQDIQEGGQLLDGYNVLKIASDAVVIKNRKTGKTFQLN